MRKVQRAIVELKAGYPVLVSNGDEAELVFSVEGLESPSFRAWLGELDSSTLRLTLTPKRLESLGIECAGAGGVLDVPLDDRDDMAAVVETVRVLSSECAPQGGFFSDFGTPGVIQEAGLVLMRQGRLLPASVSVTVPAAAWSDVHAALYAQDLIKVEARDVLAFDGSVAQHLIRISEAQVPLEGAEETRFVMFREGGGLREHLALMIGGSANWPDPVPVRMHSACLTGDLFGSLRCDCGEQLRGAVQSIMAAGGGILLYLAQEGRDIGLANKLRAYSLQDKGLDTVDADQVLGFGEDERQYGIAVSMLRSLGINRIDLLTNNPAKLQAMRDGGIEVGQRRELLGKVTPHNRRYLAAKAERAGHLLETALKAGGH